MKTLLLGIALLVGASSIAQDWTNYRVGTLYDGYIILDSGEKVEGKIKAQTKIKNQTGVEFIPADGSGKRKYKKDELQEYMIGDKKYVAIKYSGGISKKAYNYNLQTEEGAINSYVYYQRSTDGSMVTKQVYHNTRLDILYANDQLLAGFAKKMSEMTSDYKELAKKVAGKEKGYKVLSILKVIAEYNEWALNQ